MELRSMFSAIFGNRHGPQTTTQYKMLDSYESFFSPGLGYSYDDPIVRTCIDTIARNAAKMGITHVKRVGGRISPVDGSLQQLLGNRPNPFMSTYDFIYKIVSLLYCHGNAFIHIKTDAKGNIVGLYPLTYKNLELREANNQLMLKFQFTEGYQTIPYTEIIHIRRHFNGNDLLGNSDSGALDESVNILNSLKESMQNAVKNCTKLRGYLKASNVVLKSESKDNVLSEFVEKFTSKDSKYGGLAIIDNTVDYQPLNASFETMDSDQMDFVRADIYRYFGLNEDIIKSDYNSDKWNSFYESVIEPLAIQLSQEFTSKLFTERERKQGHEIIFTCDKLQYASLKDKIELVHQLQPAGFITINEGRELFGFAPVPDGDIRMVSLNHIKADDATLYQTGKEGRNSGQEKDGIQAA